MKKTRGVGGSTLVQDTRENGGRRKTVVSCYVNKKQPRDLRVSGLKLEKKKKKHRSHARATNTNGATRETRNKKKLLLPLLQLCLCNNNSNNKNNHPDFFFSSSCNPHSPIAICHDNQKENFSVIN